MSEEQSAESKSLLMLRDCVIGVAQMMERCAEEHTCVFTGRHYVPVEYLRLYSSNLRILVEGYCKEKS